MKILTKKAKHSFIHALIRATAYSLLILMVKVSKHSPLNWISWHWVFAPFIILIGVTALFVIVSLLAIWYDEKRKQEDNDNDPPVPPAYYY